MQGVRQIFYIIIPSRVHRQRAGVLLPGHTPLRVSPRNPENEEDFRARNKDC